MRNEIANIIKNFSEEYYNELKLFSNDIITFNYVSQNKIDRDIYIEKVYDYIETYLIKNNDEEKDIVDIYVSSLLHALTMKIEKKTREDTYLSKIKKIAKEIKKDCDDNSLDKLRDFTRVFVSLYHLKVNSNNKFDFNLSKTKLDEVMKRLKESKAYSGLFAKGKTITDVCVKYNKYVFVDYLLELFYLDMLNNKPNSDFGD